MKPITSRFPPYFYPRSPRGERLDAVGVGGLGQLISIHAPREGSDEVIAFSYAILQEFLSTLPARGATNCPGCGAV